MGVITISRGSYSKGREIAEKLAANLGYECISRDILLEASEHFNIPEIKLIRAAHDPPSILDRFKHGKKKYINYIREAFLEHIQKDNVVYHGLVGHFFLQGIPNIFKVRIIANMKERIQEEMARDDIGEKEARHILARDDEEKRKWGMYLYGIDAKDSQLYDLVLQIGNMQVEDAVDILAQIAQRPCFRTTPESRSMIRDNCIAAKSQRILSQKFPLANVECKNGSVVVNLETSLSLEKEVKEEVTKALGDLDGIKEIRVNAVPFET